MGVWLQIDLRDFLHPVPAEQRMFVVHECRECDARLAVHVDPLDAPPYQEQNPEYFAERLAPNGPIWTLPAPDLLTAEHPAAHARLRALTDHEDVYARLIACTGADTLMGGMHAGGHHYTGSTAEVTPTPRCGVCEAPCGLVVQLPARLSTVNSLWACREHPEFVVFSRHS